MLTRNSERLVELFVIVVVVAAFTVFEPPAPVPAPVEAVPVSHGTVAAPPPPEAAAPVAATLLWLGRATGLLGTAPTESAALEDRRC
jgi:hypothetical protein